MKPSKHPDLPATLTSTKGLSVGQHVTINGVWYMISAIIDDRRVLMKQVRASKQPKGHDA